MQAWNPQDENAPSPFLAPTGGTTLIEEAVEKFILFHSIWANYELIPKPECFGHFEGDSPESPCFPMESRLGSGIKCSTKLRLKGVAPAQQDPLRLV